MHKNKKNEKINYKIKYDDKQYLTNKFIKK